MTLNFPAGPVDGQIHIDPQSSLKYIFNAAIGGWESAIQPPCIITTDNKPPNIELEGFLWWNQIKDEMFIYRGGVWIPVFGYRGGTEGGGPVYIGIEAPQNPSVGDLWWNVKNGNLYVWYEDPNSAQWVITLADPSGGIASAVTVSPQPPIDPIDGQMWFNPINQTLYVWSKTVDQWLSVNSEIAGVDAIKAISPIRVDGGDQNSNPGTGAAATPTISILPGTETQAGAVRFAANSEIGSNAAAATPAFIEDNYDKLIPTATDTTEGIVRLATDLDDMTAVVTPEVLRANLTSLGLATPVGTIIMYAADTAPEGYLVCQGQAVPNGNGTVPLYQGGPLISGNFAPLYAVVGANLPDMRGLFVRGYDAGRGMDPGRTFGSFQGDAFKEHDHGVETGPATGGATSIDGGGNRSSNQSVIRTSEEGASETRPVNVALSYCIKY